MALAAGGYGGYFAGVFHLTTHAGFKALLFLCSGVFIHHYGTNDIYELGRHGCRRLRIPTICIIIGAAALSGLPPLSGFFSKEAIMAALAGLSNPIWLAVGLLGVFLTAYYAFRVIFVICFPQPDARGLCGPFQFLGIGSPGRPSSGSVLGYGLAFDYFGRGYGSAGFFEGRLEHFLVGGLIVTEVHESGHLAWAPYVALVLAAAGLLLAWLEFGRRSARQVGFVERVRFSTTCLPRGGIWTIFTDCLSIE